MADKALIREIDGMVQRYVDGAPWSAMSFDLVRTKELSIEQVFCVLMSHEDFKVISLMLKVVRNKRIKQQVLDVIVEKLKQVEKEQESSPDDPS